MSGFLNINGSDDPSYRYKMPRVVGKIEGRGNGIKTVIVNCADVAQSLKRSPGQVTKFFGCELGARSEYLADIDRSSVSGAIETKNLQEMLTIFIEKFVLCSQCNNPETVQVLKGKKKNMTIELHCKACGAVTEADNSHKLCTFIHKELGPEKNANKKEERKKKKQEKMMRKGDSEENGSLNGSQDSGEDGVKEKKDKKKKKKEKKKKKDKDYTPEELERKRKKKEKKRREKALASEAKEPHESDSSDEQWGDVVTGVGSISVQDAAAIDSAAMSIASFINREDNADIPQKRLLEEVKTLQTNCGLKSDDQIAILFFALCEIPVDKYMDSIYFPALGELVSSVDQQKEVLSCMEESVGRAEAGPAQDAAKTRIPLLLKCLYDEDVVDEETILGWYEGTFTLTHERAVVDDAAVSEIKESAKPIIEWLREADEDSDEE